MIRKHKKFLRPRRLYDSPRISAENLLVEAYGLKNKREIWKTEAKVRYYRNRAKNLITASESEKKKLFDKLNTIGLEVNSIADVLALDKENILKRRLASVVARLGLAKNHKEARQMISHKRVVIGNRSVSSPSYIVRVKEENLIRIKNKSAVRNEKKEIDEVKNDGN